VTTSGPAAAKQRVSRQNAIQEIFYTGCLLPQASLFPGLVTSSEYAGLHT